MVLDALMRAVPRGHAPLNSSRAGKARQPAAEIGTDTESSDSDQKPKKEVRFTNGHQQTTSAEWELVESSDSRWFRLAEGVGAGWPVKLENTRYWLRLYRRL